MRDRSTADRRAGWSAALACCLPFASATTAIAQASVDQPTGTSDGAQLSLGMVFTCFMVMLGPVKLVSPFAALTSQMDRTEARLVASKAFACACAGGIVAAVIGQSTLVSWGISPPALHLAAGGLLLLVALKTVLAQYDPPNDTSKRSNAPVNPALSPLAFPTILTPHGIATFILLLAITRDPYREVYIIVLFLAVMALNWLVMWHASAIVRHGGVALAILGAVLGVLQVALAMQMMLDALRALQVLPGR
jgi:multiple antibiotic resistance protein